MYTEAHCKSLCKRIGQPSYLTPRGCFRIPIDYQACYTQHTTGNAEGQLFASNNLICSLRTCNARSGLRHCRASLVCRVAACISKLTVIRCGPACKLMYSNRRCTCSVARPRGPALQQEHHGQNTNRAVRAQVGLGQTADWYCACLRLTCQGSIWTQHKGCVMLQTTMQKLSRPGGRCIMLEGAWLQFAGQEKRRWQKETSGKSYGPSKASCSIPSN